MKVEEAEKLFNKMINDGIENFDGQIKTI
jgi:pentatricopeptide repeat protein